MDPLLAYKFQEALRDGIFIFRFLGTIALGLALMGITAFAIWYIIYRLSSKVFNRKYLDRAVALIAALSVLGSIASSRKSKNKK